MRTGLVQIQVLREETVAIIRKHKLEDKFFQINEALPEKYRREKVVTLADELLFALCFAGIGGTANGAVAIGRFLHAETIGVPAESVKFEHSAEQMLALYRNNPEQYILARAAQRAAHAAADTHPVSCARLRRR